MAISDNNIANCVLVYFDFAYYLLFSPFRLTLTSNKISQFCWKIHKCKIQCIGYIIMGFLGMFAILAHYKSILSDATANGRDPVVYFSFLACLFTAILNFKMHKIFWFESHKFLEIINLTSSKSAIVSYQFKQNIWANKLIWQFICVLVLIEISFGFYFLLGLHQNNANIIIKNLIHKAYQMFFLQENLELVIGENIFILDYLLVILYVLAWLNQYLIERFLNLVLLCSTMILWTASNAFKETLKPGNTIVFINQEILVLKQKPVFKNKQIFGKVRNSKRAL